MFVGFPLVLVDGVWVLFLYFFLMVEETWPAGTSELQSRAAPLLNKPLVSRSKKALPLDHKRKQILDQIKTKHPVECQKNERDLKKRPAFAFRSLQKIVTINIRKTNQQSTLKKKKKHLCHFRFTASLPQKNRRIA